MYDQLERLGGVERGAAERLAAVAVVQHLGLGEVRAPPEQVELGADHLRRLGLLLEGRPAAGQLEAAHGV